MTRKLFLTAIALLLLAACATQETFRDARVQIEAGNEEEGLTRLEEAMRESPNDVELRNYYLRHKAVAVQRYLQLGDKALAASAFDKAQAAYARAQRFDPENARARNGLERVAKAREAHAILVEARKALRDGDLETAYARAQDVLKKDPDEREARAIVRRYEGEKARAAAQPPQLAAALDKRITIELRDAPVRAVFELVSQRSGLNFVYDRDIPAELRTTVFVKDTTIDEVIKYVLVTSGLEKRVLNPSTVLIYPNTPEKAQAYKELMVKSFYLGNADAKQTANMLRSLVKTRDMYVDEKLNMLVMRDTPEAVRVAEKLIASQDLAEPEVMLEVEVLEVGHTELTELGIEWPDRVSMSLVGAGGVRGELTGDEARNINGGLVRVNVSDPLVALNLRQQAGRTNVLANPRIRVKNREKARIHIGDRVPVITTTAGATGFVSESVNYLDVGLKLEVQPQVHLDDEVGIKVGLEVSNITNQIESGGGTVAYQVGTRNAATSLRLKDGETQVLAGLINDEDRRSANRVPGLSKLPVIGRLFSNDEDTVNKTEVVLLITPHVLRNIDRPGAATEQFNSGTELEVGAKGAPLPTTIVLPPQPQGTQPEPPAAPSAPAITAPAAGPQPRQEGQ